MKVYAGISKLQFTICIHLSDSHYRALFMFWLATCRPIGIIYEYANLSFFFFFLFFRASVKEGQGVLGILLNIWI